MDGKVPTGMSLEGVITLQMPTFSATAEMAGLSRIMGVYHIQADNVEGLKLGRKVATYVYPKTQAYFNGIAGDGTRATTVAKVIN